jgi:hypothetical protein
VNSEAEERVHAVPDGSRLGGVRILVVDDDVRETIAEVPRRPLAGRHELAPERSLERPERSGAAMIRPC